MTENQKLPEDPPEEPEAPDPWDYLKDIEHTYEEKPYRDYTPNDIGVDYVMRRG